MSKLTNVEETLEFDALLDVVTSDTTSSGVVLMKFSNSDVLYSLSSTALLGDAVVLIVDPEPEGALQNGEEEKEES